MCMYPHAFIFIGLGVEIFIFRQIEQLHRCEIIKEQEVKVLCAKARYQIV